MSLPLGVPRRAFSYDEGLEDTAPMTPPPADLCASVLWKQPVIPERKYQELSKVTGRPVAVAARARECLLCASPPAWPGHGAGRGAQQRPAPRALGTLERCWDKGPALLPCPVMGTLRYG